MGWTEWAKQAGRQRAIRRTVNQIGSIAYLKKIVNAWSVLAGIIKEHRHFIEERADVRER
jgi:hypothetical protein